MPGLPWTKMNSESVQSADAFSGEECAQPADIFPSFDINRPWESLDPWQKEYIETPAEQDCFLLTTRQAGKTTAMSIKAVEKCLKEFRKGDAILIASLTEKQGYLILAKALAYAQEKYPQSIAKGKNKPTMHKILFTNGSAILCYPAGETGEGLRGFTIKKLFIDEGSRMSEEFFISVLPMLSVTKGSMDIASTPFGKKHKDGTEKFFYKCSYDNHFKKFYVHAKDCPRHTPEFLAREKERMSKFHYAQEYEAVFTDELLRLFSDELLKEICVLKKEGLKHRGKYYIGADIAGYGEDECTIEVFEKRVDKSIEHRESIVEKRKMTTDTSRRIIELTKRYDWIRKIGIDDGGLGFGVWCELMGEESTKRKTLALNNASRETDEGGEKSKKLLKEEMYFNLLNLMEQGKVKLLDDDEVKASLASMQYEEDKIFGSYSHIAEGIVRGIWVASKDKDLNIFAHSF